jgi:uncharacterized protein YndB with AHSA1/START domain
MKNKTQFEQTGSIQLHIIHEINAPAEEVWKAWTESALLDQWWAPKPWHASTRLQEFKPGGRWIYAMQGPEGEEHWATVEYESVVPGKQFTATDAFSDKEGNINTDLPQIHWKFTISPSGNTTRMQVDLTFNTEEDLKKLTEMGFREGFTLALGNLDEMLERK